MLTTSESLLIRLTSSQHSDAWQEFAGLYTPLLFYWARKTGLSVHDAEDLVQDVLILVYRKLPTTRFQQPGGFRAWLRTVTMNRYRELGRRKRAKVISADTQVMANLADESVARSSWDKVYAGQLVSAAMETMRHDFAPATWTALQKLLASGEPATQIAREEEISVSTLYAARARLLARLRQKLDGLLD